MRSQGLFLSGGSGGRDRVCLVLGACPRTFASCSPRVRLVLAMAFLVGGGIQRVSSMSPGACGVVVSCGRRGKGVTWRFAGHRFVWQAQGIVRGS